MTFYTRKAALHAQDALHNIKTLDGVSTPEITLFRFDSFSGSDAAHVPTFPPSVGDMQKAPRILPEISGGGRNGTRVTSLSDITDSAGIIMISRPRIDVLRVRGFQEHRRKWFVPSCPLVHRVEVAERHRDVNQMEKFEANLFFAPKRNSCSRGKLSELWHFAVVTSRVKLFTLQVVKSIFFIPRPVQIHRPH